MSSNSKKDEQSTTNKSVRFAANIASSAAPTNNTEAHYNDGRRKKRPRLERPNEDEADDVDDWRQEDDEADGGAILKTHDLLDAKRKRQKRKHGEDIDSDDDEQEDTRLHAETSLLSEEVAVEPFNMNAEQNDGSGYFDGDTYVFRKRNAEEEPDAWLESLDESKDVASIQEGNEEETSDGTAMDDLSKEDLFAKIVPLVSENESVLQAVARYGNLLKRQKKSEDAPNDASIQTAQKALNDLTEAANALMLKGHVDIYQQSRSDLLKLLPDSIPAASTNKKPVVSWEYRGNQDGQIHGPYTTEQMLSWTRAGYFVGAQAVQIRTISSEAPKTKSIGDDLMSDLMDDDEGEERTEPTQVKGEWQSSNSVDFTSFA